MEYGYSMLRGVYVYAFALNYHDCEGYMICCPACRERVFKAVRVSSDGKDHHYLSHYKRDPNAADDCELRVANMSVTVSDCLDYVPRGQSLADFVELLNWLIEADTVAFSPDDLDEQELQREVMAAVSETEFLMEFANDLADEAAASGIFTALGEFEGQVHHYVAGFLAEDGSSESAAFAGGSPATQVRIAFDIWKHLLTPPAAENFRRLFCRAYAVLLTRLGATAAERETTEGETLLLNAMRMLPRQDGMTGDLTLTLMAGHPVGVVYGIGTTNLREGLKAHLVEEMIGVLLRLPYENARGDVANESKEAAVYLPAREDLVRIRSPLMQSALARDDFSPQEIEDAVVECLPRKGRIARELLLRKTAKFLEFDGLTERTRSRINKAIFRQAKEGRVGIDASSEYVWLCSSIS